jgi:lauroyl/myristoyl acyltransferase
MRLFVRILAALPLPVLYAIGGVVFGVTFHLLRWRRSVAAGNLDLAFPRRAKWSGRRS